MKLNNIHLPMLALLIFGLNACGGGGGSESSEPSGTVASLFIQYDSTTGDIFRYSIYDNTIEGRRTGDTGYDSPGDNANWLDSDDTVSLRRYYEYDENGVRTRRISLAAGVDGVLLTNDDEIRAYRSYQYDLNGNLLEQISYNSAGIDGEWFTLDDVGSQRESTQYNNLGQRTLYVDYNSAGNDGEWGSDDDGVSDYRVFDYSNSANYPDQTGFAATGDDGEWFTFDDTVSFLRLYTNFNNGIPEILQVYSGTELDSYYRNEYDENGNITLSAWYTSPGPDGLWNQGNDDIVQTYNTYQYNAENKRVMIVVYNFAGINGAWFDEDDEIVSYVEMRYDANGFRTQTIFLSGTGNDGEWFTADDQRSRYDEFELCYGC